MFVPVIYTFVLNTVSSEDVFVTVDVNDIKRIAKYFVSEPVADKIAEFVVSMGVKEEAVDDDNKVPNKYKLKNSDENDEPIKSSIETSTIKKRHRESGHKSRMEAKINNANHKTVKKFIPDLNEDSDDATEGYQEFLVKYNEKARKHEHDKRKHVTIRARTSFYRRQHSSDADEINNNYKVITETPQPSSSIPKSGNFDDFTATKISQRESSE